MTSWVWMVQPALTLPGETCIPEHHSPFGRLRDARCFAKAGGGGSAHKSSSTGPCVNVAPVALGRLAGLVSYAYYLGCEERNESPGIWPGMIFGGMSPIQIGFTLF